MAAPAWPIERIRTLGRMPTLLDIVLHYMLWQLAAALEQIKEFECELHMQVLAGAGNLPVPAEKRTQIIDYVKFWRDQFQRIELQSALERIDGPPLRIGLQNGLTRAALEVELRVLREAVASELKYRRFAFIPTDKARVMDRMGHDWEVVWRVFPDAKHDTEEANYSYALDLNTACVFHSMRAAEHGLRRLGKTLKIALTNRGAKHPIEFADWDKIITACKNKLSASRALPHGAKRLKTLEIYSAAADHCEYMKDIWRNNIAHARKPYEPLEALQAMMRVKDFLSFLARGL